MLTDHQQEALKRLEAENEVVVDVETSGLDWRRNHIVGYVLTFGPMDRDSYYLPVRHLGGGNIPGCSVPETKDGWKGDKHPIEPVIARELSRPDKLILGHNLAFDLRFLSRIGMMFDARFEDTMINAPLINEWQAGFSLDFCCKEAGVPTKKTDIYEYIMDRFPEARTAPKQAMGHYWRLAGDDERAHGYAVQDGLSTYLLSRAQRSVIHRDGLTRVWDVECRLIPVLARMMVRGIRIDEERLHQVKKLIEGKLEEANAALPADFNSRSPVAVRKIMEEAGHKDWPLTAQGRPSFPENWLVTNPVGAQIVASRKLRNLLSSFIQPMLETHLWNGRVHPEFHQLRGDEFGTVTGRLSSSNPNTMQVPKRNRELGELFRSVFVPDKGKIWGSVDFSQAEPRILGYYARCKVLLDGYRSNPPVDAHQAVATAANVDRELGKRLNQTIITGGGRKVLTTKYGIPPEVVDDIWPKYFAAMPELRPFQLRAADVFRSRGYVMSLLGRRARLRDPQKAYTAVNRLLQMGNCDLLKYKMVQIDEYLRSENADVQMLNNVHDAIDFQFNEEGRKHYEEALKIMVNVGEEELIHMDVPMVVEAGEGASWAEATWN